MKNLSLILNAVLLVAVGVLFYLHFSSAKPGTAHTSAPVGDVAIAYINSDSIVKHYAFMDDTKAVLEAKAKKLDADLNNRANSLRGEIAAYQRNQSSMTIGQAQALEADLGKKQQNLQLYQQSLGQQLAEEEAKLNKELYDRITAFLKTYSEANNIQVVVKFDTSSDVLYGQSALDITAPVLEGLNAQYKDEKSGKKTPADTTATK
ncbi:MAG TPA: OmpH family outer membrane protein [Cyclobacteriaceae bacterium]|nr:OmpH family outer membrane protein [Cyclobacteriaceae bacterium]HMV10522.1 OmpH family outer membrane protein [Cyclobacteriaceae bacterium]HMV91775.1 OmpH family outer membrane protein [Cyclobacteriaceae bacterium]HMX01815.1 OmpH family outer membrane protein [Cyclobacteriaceae bacterium]HMX51562.1 OmpH family outer membrane protein [Cyclobacteriaceae bacterium]